MQFFKKNISFFLCLGLLGTLAGCYLPSAQNNVEDVSSNGGSQRTLGTVQKEIHIGMPSADVMASLGSPNVIARDKDGKEVWTYSNISSQQAYSRSSGGIVSLFIPWQSTGAQSSSQKTLTVIIYFDNQSKVSNFTYRYSQF